MVDAVRANEQVEKKCKINLRISHEELKKLLGILATSYSLNNPPNPNAIKQELPKIDPNYFSAEFAPDKTFFYYADPFQAVRNDLTFDYVLTRSDIIDLFEDINKELIEKGHLGNTDNLGKEEADFLRRLKNGLRNNKEFLETDIVFFIRVIDQLEHGEAKEEATPAVKYQLHPKLVEIKNQEFSPAVSWPYVKKLAESATPDKVWLGVTTIKTTVDNQPFTITVLDFREFLNEWLGKLYSDEFKKVLETKQIVLPENEEFNTYNRFVAYTDREDWNELDTPVVKFILEKLSPVIDEFLKAKDKAPPPAYISESTQTTESENTVLTKDLKKKNEDELNEFLKRFDDMGTTYNREASRLTTILLPQFFAMHGFQGSLDALEGNDPIDFLAVEHEFRSELLNVIRSLSLEELSLLEKKGEAYKFRLLVLRKLYGKLGSNPRFIASLNRYKDEFAERLEERVEAGEITQAQADQQLRAINRQITKSDQKFYDEVVSHEKTPVTEWAQDLVEKTGDKTVKDFADLRNISQADYQSLLARLIATEKFTLDFEILLRNLDVIIAERWSPERIRNLSLTNASIVFGLQLPKELTDSSQKYQTFLNITTEYLYSRRQRLADHYQLDSISREDGRFVTIYEDGTVKDRSSSSPDGADLDSLKNAQSIAAKHKAGGGEALIAARASDSRRVKEYRGGNSLSKSIDEIHEETKKQRKKNFDDEYEREELRFREMSIDDKRKFLESLGVLTTGIDEDNLESDVVQEFLVQQFQKAKQEDTRSYVADLEELAYYDDQDDGVVEERTQGKETSAPRVERYGTPTAPHSLLSGTLKVRGRLQSLKDRVKDTKKIRKATDAVRKSLETAEKAIATPLMGPLAQNKYTRRVGLAIIGGFIFDTLRMFLEGGILTKAGAFFGGLLGGGVGFGISYLTGGIGAIPLTAVGGLTGAWGGAKAGWDLEQRLGMHQNGADKGGGGLDLGLGGGSASTGGSMIPASAIVTNSALNTATPQVLAMCAVGAYAGSALVTQMGAFMAGLQPPTLGTIGGDGIESQYVKISKIASPANNFPSRAEIPDSITYRIVVEAKENYRIEITGFEDEFKLSVNQEARGNEPPPTISEEWCSNINFDNTPNRVAHVNGQLEPGEIQDGQLLIGECTIPVDDSFHDTGLLNTFKIDFNVTVEGQEPILNQTAESGELVCFGECPQNQTGGWPTTGRLTQGPYGSYSHSVVDAIDIGAGVGTPVCATFKGTAWFFNVFDDDPNKQGYVFPLRGGGVSRIYGRHVMLKTDQGFVLLYGHLSRHPDQFELGVPYDVDPGTVLGYVGNSGDRPMGMHLHYEYRVATGNEWRSLAPGGRRLLEGILPEPYREGLQVTGCNVQ